MQVNKAMNRCPTSPGEMLLAEFLVPKGITLDEVANTLGVPRSTVEDLVVGSQSVTPALAVGLSEAVGMSPGFWLGLQADLDLWRESRQS